MINYPPGYEPRPPRDPDAVLLELNRRTGYTQGEVRSIPLSQASPAPEEQIVRVSKFIKAQLKKHPVPGFKGACGRNKSAGKNS